MRNYYNLIQELILDLECEAENTDDLESEFDSGYLSGLCFAIKSLENLIKDDGVNRPITAEIARELTEKFSQDLLEETFQEILSDIRKLALNGITSSNFYVDLNLSEQIDLKLELLGFQTSVESATPSEDLINVAW